MPSTQETHGYFSGPGPALYGTHHAPAGTAVGGAVLLAPFGEERKCAARLLTLTARALTGAGWIVLRADYRGTGNSLGDHAVATLADWQADAAAAVAALGTPPARTVAVGARLGANLALRLNPESLAGVCLWEPLTGGVEYLDEMARRKQIKAMIGGDDGTEAAPEESWAAGAVVDFDGFAVGAGLAAQLRELRLTEQLAGWPRPAGILHVSGARRFTGAWAAVEALAAGRPEMDLKLVREKPFWGRLDYFESEELIRETVDFCNRLLPVGNA